MLWFSRLFKKRKKKPAAPVRVQPARSRVREYQPVAPQQTEKTGKTEQTENTRATETTKKTAKPQTIRRIHQKVDVIDLRVGMFVSELDIPWEESSFMFQGLEIRSQEDIQKVKENCRYVWADYDDIDRPSDHSESEAAPPVMQGVGATLNSDISLEDEIETATETHALASNTLENLFQDIKLGAQVDGGQVRQAVGGCVDSILRNQDASVWLTRIQAKHEATAQHSMNVSALSIVLAKALQCSNREMEDIGVCGMLHDVGKTAVPSEILEKSGPLTAEEMIEVRKHTRYGRDILLSTQSVLSGAADVAYAHHERPDGQGYPRQLKSESIPLFAKIVSITEAYDTMTTQQPYREAMAPSDALQELYHQRGKQFDEKLVVTFIDALGIFPPGSIIEMTSGEVGIVLSNTRDKLRPRVIMVMDAAGEPTPQRILDLSQVAQNDNGEMYKIKTTHRDGAFGIHVGEFQRAGLRLG